MSINREDLKKLITISYKHQKQYLAGLTEEEKTAVGQIGDWSPKDVMAHVIYWDADMAGDLADLEQVNKGDGGGGVDHINAEIWQQYKDISWPEISELVDQVHLDLFESLKQLDEDQLTDPQRYEWTNGRPLWQRINFGSFYHPMQHVAELVAKRGQLEQADEIQEETASLQIALVDSDTWRGNVLYNLGCHYALSGQREKALENIGRGLELYPYLKEWAPQDTDLAGLHDDPDFQRLLD